MSITSGTVASAGDGGGGGGGSNYYGGSDGAGTGIVAGSLSHSQGANAGAGSVTITIGAPDCADDKHVHTYCPVTGGPINLAATESGVIYQLYINGGPVSPSTTVTGTGSAMPAAFTVTTAGVYTVFAYVNGEHDCTLTPTNGTVTVSAAPTITSATTAQSCNGSNTNIPLTASIPGSTITWTVGATGSGISGAAAGSGSSIVQPLFNSSSTSDGTQVYVVQANLGACPSGTSVFVINTVHPTPVITTGPTSSCSGTAENVPFTASVTSNFTWTLGTNVGSITGGAACTSCNSPIQDILVDPSTSADGSLLYHVTATSVTGGCVSSTTDVTNTVHRTPTINTAAAQASCSGINTTINLTTTGVPSNFAWTLGTNTGLITNGSASSGSTIAQPLTNPSSTTDGSLVYVVTATATTAGNCTSTANITNTVHPTPVISTSATQASCSGVTTNIPLAASVSSNFTWALGTNTGSIATPAACASSCGATIAQVLTNPDALIDGSIVYMVTATSTSGNCVSTVANITQYSTSKTCYHYNNTYGKL